MEVERKNQQDKTPKYSNNMGSTLMITPPINEDYWAYRVHLYKDQYIVGFPKFFTIGIGFAIEDKDGNTNLPYRCDAEEIADHIWVNHKYSKITKPQIIEAIKLIQQAILEDKIMKV